MFVSLVTTPVGPSSYFYGLEVLGYLYTMLSTFIKQFSWQVQVAMGIIALCVVCVLVMGVFFARLLVRRRRSNDEYEQACNRYMSQLREILLSEESYSGSEMEYLLHADRTELCQTKAKHMLRMVMKIRMEEHDRVFIPNLQHLCQITGIQGYLENNLVKGKDVQRTMQILMTLPLRVSEGALSNYTGNKDKRVSELARTYAGFCSKTQPFHYVIEDIDKPFNPWYPTIFHRMCAWHIAKGHPIPQLLSLARQSKNPDRVSLFLSEIPYWGSDQEKKGIEDFLTHTSPKCRHAAIEAIARIGDPEMEPALVKCYAMQLPKEKRAVLRALLSLKTGKQHEFFRDVYMTTTSQHTRAVALSCLYNYDEEGRRIFEELRASQAFGNKSVFFEQVTQGNVN